MAEINDSKLHRMYVTNDKYDYVMAMAGACERLSYGKGGCGCEDECAIVKMYLRWKNDA